MKKQQKRFYVYVVCDPRPNENNAPIWVGKGQRDRTNTSINKRNKFFQNVVKKIRAAGFKPKTTIVAYFDNETDAFAYEVELIAKYGRRDRGAGTLTNLTDGGEGVSGFTNPAAKTRAIEYNRSAEGRAIASKKIKDAWNDPEYRTLMHGVHTAQAQERWSDPQNRAAHGTKIKDHWSDPNSKYREIVVAELRRINADPKKLTAQSELMRQLNADPEFRAKAASAHWTPENRAAFAEEMRRRWNDPIFRATQTARNNQRKRNDRGQFV